jgi:hypothetical protein
MEADSGWRLAVSQKRTLPITARAICVEVFGSDLDAYPLCVPNQPLTANR